jgi:hypothetical protein
MFLDAFIFIKGLFKQAPKPLMKISSSSLNKSWYSSKMECAHFSITFASKYNPYLTF